MKGKGINISPLNIEDLKLDIAKCLLPQSLYWLLRWIVTGELFCDHPPASTINTTDERKIIMLAQDLIHCASHARIKLPKQIGLAMCVKHLTGSKQLITLLNRMGHSSSYEEIEQVETSLANESLARANAHGIVIPTNIRPGSFIQMAADNNDINEETIDGKNTTHATTMAVYQRKQYGPIPLQVVLADHSKKKRSLDSSRSLVIIEDVNVGSRRPNLADFVGKDVIHWFQSDHQLPSTCMDDLCWMLLRLSDPFLLNSQQKPEEQTIPGWSGFNTIRYPSIPVRTMIGYHPMIHAEASNFSTLYTLMKLAQKICHTVGQRDSVITLDLALYSKAKQLQMKYPEEFKNTVIRMGGFHIALNYLALLGKKYAQSGLEDLLIESGVYAAGTTSVLMLGKSYNRGIRAHKLSMEALFRLLWQAFLEWLSKQEVGLEDRAKQHFVDAIKECRNSVPKKEFSSDCWMDLQSCAQPLTSLLDAFKSESREKSKVFRFWEGYIDMVLVLLQFIKAERTGNWKLHLSATASMVPHFFSMDRVNYARWIPVYLSDMNVLELNHPEVYREFISGNHSVSRSNQPFAQVWPDMALEQSVNHDSKSKGGIVGMSTKEEAVDRWFLTIHERAAITQAIKEMCAVDNCDRVGTHKEGGTTRVRRDERDVQKLGESFSSGLLNDPFCIPDDIQDIPLPLSNLATGVVLPDADANRLLDAEESGRKSMNKFISSRIESNEISLWDPIQKLKIKSFSSVAKKITVNSRKEKILSANADREIFGRLLVAAKHRDIDLQEVLSYELCSIPISLAHPDGSLRKTVKSTLMPILEKDVTCPSSLPHSQIHTACLIDAMALIQMLKSAGTATFGELAGKYTDFVTSSLGRNSCTRVDLVFDQYRSVSIKAGERSKRGESSSLEVNIHSASTPVPKQWAKFISNPKNKENLAAFLCSALSEQLPARLTPSQEVVLAGGFKDGLKTVFVTENTTTEDPNLRSDHEEADTRLLLHAKHAASTHQRIIIQSPDTDVAVLSIAHFEELGCQELWFKTGVKDKQRFIPVHDVCDSLGRPLCKCLLSFHALTGCDSTSAFSGMGKKKAWKVLLKEKQAQQDLSLLGENPSLQESVKGIAESFICSIYAPGKSFEIADEARYFLFCQRNLKSEELPPTSDCLGHHLKRANFQVFVWNKSLVPLQNLPSPEGNGWKLDDGRLVPVLMTKSPAPSGITELTTCRCTTSECKRNCSCKMNDLACTEACLCMADEGCNNPLNGDLLSHDDSSESETE